MAWLNDILAAKREEIVTLARRPLPAPPARREVALARRANEPLRLITEIKRRSPSAGALSCKLSVTERAVTYERAGARMISVLTDTRFFDGSYEHLAAVRDACGLPLLCKDFVIDECQLDAARAFGADAVLLIVRCLEGEALPRLYAAAKARDLVPFVEVASEAEARRAVELGAELVGVNARNLDTLAMDAELAARVLALLPATVTRVHLSGLGNPEAVTKVRASAVDAALIGEALMRQDDPEPLLRALVQAANGPS